MKSRKNNVRIVTVLILTCYNTAACAGASPSQPLHAFFKKNDNVYLTTGNPVMRQACPTPPEPMRDLYFKSMYSREGGNSSIIDPKAYTKYKADTQFINAYEAGLASMANRYLISDSTIRRETASCVLDWLWIWAKHGALNGEANETGRFVRKWVLASAASALMQIKDESSLEAKKKEFVKHWMRNVANSVRHDFPAKDERKSRHNNHLYWAAWSVMATGVALDQPDLYEWALKRLRYGIRSIEKDGTLPLEMGRGIRALNYHSYAAIPLFAMAETAAANGDSVYDENNEALFRLAKRIISGIKDPSYFEKKTGEKQELLKTMTSSNLIWLEIYYKRTQDKNAQRLLKKLRPMKLSRVGGNMTLLMTQPAN